MQDILTHSKTIFFYIEMGRLDLSLLDWKTKKAKGRKPEKTLKGIENQKLNSHEMMNLGIQPENRGKKQVHYWMPPLIPIFFLNHLIVSCTSSIIIYMCSHLLQVAFSCIVHSYFKKSCWRGKWKLNHWKVLWVIRMSSYSFLK